MKAMAQKFGGGGQQQSPAEAAAELAGKRLIPGHALPHVVLHTVQVGRHNLVLCCLGTRVSHFSTQGIFCAATVCSLYQLHLRV